MKTEKQNRVFFSQSKIHSCTCENIGQDNIYGKKMRLFNHAPSKATKPKRYRCTVCLSEKEF